MRHRGNFRSMADINITSLVDVTLTLLIIFMLTAPYIQGGVEVNLPEAATRTTIVKEGPVISITKNRQVFLQEQVVEMDDLPRALAAYVQIINCHRYLDQPREARSALRRVQYLLKTVPESEFAGTMAVGTGTIRSWRTRLEFTASSLFTLSVE